MAQRRLVAHRARSCVVFVLLTLIGTCVGLVEEWSVTVDGELVTIGKDGEILFEAMPAPSEGAFGTVHEALPGIQWLYQATPIVRSDLDKLQGLNVSTDMLAYVDSVTKGQAYTMEAVAPSVLRLRLLSEAPYIVYLSQHWGCTRTLATLGSSFSCSAFLSEPLALNADIRGDASSVFILASSKFDPAGADLRERVNDLLSLAVFHAAAGDTVKAQLLRVSRMNRERSEGNMVEVTLVYVFVGLSAWLLLWMSAVLMHWLWPGPSCCKHRGAIALLAYVLAFTAITALVCWLAGLAGFLFLTCICLLWIIAISIVYCVKAKQYEEPEDWYSDCPNRFSNQQIILFFGGLVTLVLLIIATFVVVGVWKIPEYYVWDRATQDAVVDPLSPMVAKALALVYTFEGFATQLKMNNAVFSATKGWCGDHWSETLTTDELKYDKIKVAYIDAYNVNMTDFVPSDFLAYSSVNAWLARKLAPNARPIFDQSDSGTVSSVADSKLMAFDSIPAHSQFWIKDEQFTVRDFVGSRAWTESYNEASMAVFRLSIQDYHRFHSPLNVTVVETYELPGSRQSLRPEGMKSKNGAVMNRRSVAILDTERFGRVVYVAVGSACVSSVTLTVKAGQQVAKGGEMGYFQYGGSTVVLVFEKNTIYFDGDLTAHTGGLVESTVRMGVSVGRAKQT